MSQMTRLLTNAPVLLSLNPRIRSASFNTFVTYFDLKFNGLQSNNWPNILNRKTQTYEIFFGKQILDLFLQKFHTSLHIAYVAVFS